MTNIAPGIILRSMTFNHYSGQEIECSQLTLKLFRDFVPSLQSHPPADIYVPLLLVLLPTSSFVLFIYLF